MFAVCLKTQQKTRTLYSSLFRVTCCPLVVSKVLVGIRVKWMPQLPSSLWVKKEGQSHPLKALNKKAVPTPNPGSRVCKSSIVHICISLISFDCCEIKKKKTTDLSSHWWTSWDLMVGSSVLVKWGRRLTRPWADTAGSSGMCCHDWLATLPF